MGNTCPQGQGQNSDGSCIKFNKVSVPAVKMYRSFEPSCPVADQLPTDYSCCVVSATAYACPPGTTCTEKGCCDADDPTVCSVHREPLDDSLLEKLD